MQRIEIVAGDDVVGSSIQDIFKALVEPGILDGFNLSVASNPLAVTVSAGSGIFDSGAFIFEDQTIDTDELPIGGGPKDFTILYLYTPTNVLGGTPAVLSFQEGLVNPDTFIGGLVLGWIRHSGGSTLDVKDFIPGRRIKLSLPQEKQKNNFVTTFAPLSKTWAQVSGVGLSITEGWSNTYNAIVTTLANTTVSVQNVVYRFPLLVPATGLGQILAEFEVPNTANVIISFYDTGNTQYAPLDNSWTFIAQSMARHVLAIPQSLALNAGAPALVQFSMTLQPGAFVRFKTIGYSSYTEPF